MSSLEYPKWLKNKKATINPENNDDKCFQYALTFALNYEQIKRIHKEYLTLNPLLTNIIKKDWKKFELNNKSIALNILFVPYNTEEIRHAYKSKHNCKHENQVILLMITDGEKLHYLAVKSLSEIKITRKISLIKKAKNCIT